jgi:TRAP-type C4-dicarboxylate transport system permease small subunit
MNAPVVEAHARPREQGTPEAAEQLFHVDEEAIDLQRYGLEDWISVAFFWVLGLVVFYQFFTRYVLNDSASWTEEIARYLLIAVVFIGAAVGVRRNNHIQVDFVYRFLPSRVARGMSTLVDGLRIAFLATACVLTVLLIDRIGASPMAVIDLPMGIVYGAVLLGFVLMTWRAVGVAMKHWRAGDSVLETPGGEA